MKLLLILLGLSVVSAAFDRKWWKHAVIYEIYTASFKDTNGDGFGDLKGITSKLDYLKDLGVDAIYMTPFFPSPMLDTGYDVSDYTDINPIFGTMADFDELVEQLKAKDIKLIMDLVINHSSNNHTWFEKSVNKEYPYTDYYVWRDPKGYDEKGHPIVPNNWVSFFSNPAWTWNEKRKQFYYHVFIPEQPDLNLRSPHVKKEINEIIKFWLKKGVDGLRMDAVPCFMEDQSFEDEVVSEEVRVNGKVIFKNLVHNRTMNIDDTFKYVYELREYVKKISSKSPFETIIMAEAWGLPDHLKLYYGNESRPGVHFPINTMLINQFDYLNPITLNTTIDYWLSLIPNITTPNWQLDNHDSFRQPYIFIQEYVHILMTLVSLLPGVSLFYYGIEIGMPIGVLRPQHRKLFSEYSRTPMQWDGSKNGGFTRKKEGWLPTNPNYYRLNVEIQKKDPDSTFNFLKMLLKLKKTETMKYGDLSKYVLSKWIYVLTRCYKGEMYVIVVNLGTEQEIVRLTPKIRNLPSALTMVLTTRNSGLMKK